VRGALAAGMTVVRVMTETTRRLAFPPLEWVIESFVGLDVDRLLRLERTGS
jgi:beta-phosphoglucomutase-like phosphatase (HAD superfamily)